MKKSIVVVAAVLVAGLLAAGGWVLLGGSPGASPPTPAAPGLVSEEVDPRLTGRVEQPPGAAPSPAEATGTQEVSLGVRGWVRDTTGSPIAGARVELRGEWRMEPRPPDAEAVTDEDGAFALAFGPRDAACQLRAVAPGYTVEEVRARSGGAPRTLRLWRAGRITGRVLTSGDAAPVADAAVTLQHLGRWDTGCPPLRVDTRSDEQGVFTLTGVPPGTYRLAVDPRAHASVTLAVSVRPGDVLERDVIVGAGCRIEGRILLDGEPAAGVFLDARTRLGHVRTAVSDETGRYAVDGLVSGVWILRARDPRIGFGSARCTIAPGADHVDLDVALRPVVTIRGRVLLDGAPVPGAWVGTDPGEYDEPGIRTDAEGRYTLTIHGWGGADEDVYAHLETHGFGEVEVPLERATSAQWDIALTRYAFIEGRIQAEDGSLLPDPLLVVEGPGPYWVERKAVEPDGSFRARVAPGRMELEVIVPGWPRPERVPCEVAPGETLRDVVIALPAGRSLRGRVVDDAGDPVARIFVRVSHRGRSVREIPTDDEGRFAFHGLQTDTVKIAAYVMGRYEQEEWQEVPVGIDDATITVRRVRSVIRGRVVDTDGRPCPSCEVIATFLARSDGTLLRNPVPQPPIHVCDAEGRFEYRPSSSHAQGRFALRARTMTEVSPPVEALSGDGGDEVVLRLAPGSRLRGTVRNKEGDAVPGVQILHTGVTAPEMRMCADDRGRYVLGPAAPGIHEITFRAWGYCEQIVEHVTRAGEDVTIDPVLFRGGDVRLAVRNGDGRPVIGAAVEFVDAADRVIPLDQRCNPNNRDPHVPREGQTTTDASGIVHRQWLPPGACRARVTLDDYETAEVAVTVVDERILDADIVLAPSE